MHATGRAAGRAGVGASIALVALALLALASTGCGGCLSCDDDPDAPSGAAPPPVGALVPDWFLPDVNPNALSFGTFVSPRHGLGRATAWYFGHST
jgi:hypothetical protein